MKYGQYYRCVDLDIPLGVVETANCSIICMNLDPQSQMARKDEMQLKYQYRCLTIVRDKVCNQPTAYALGSIEGCVAIQYLNQANP